MKLFSSLFAGPLVLHSKQKIIKEKDLCQLLEAKEILQEAKSVAEKKRIKTEEECIELRKTAVEEGRQEGLEKFNEHILALDAAAKKIYLDTQKLILSIALTAAKKIVTKELSTSPDKIVDIVIQAMRPAKQNKKVTIFVSKQDRHLLDSNKEKIKEMFDQINILSIQEKGDISPGGCIIETETGIINASIENQWNALELAFKRYKH
jgi:type III secretion protein L